MVCDMSFLFYGRNQLLSTVEDVNRAYSIGELSTAAQPESAIKTAFQPISPNLDVSTTLLNGVVETSATVPANDLTAVGIHLIWGNFDITVSSRQVNEVRT